MLPNYKIMEWNESNCDIENEIDYVKEAYKAKKYAFVSDYIRLRRLYEYGGVYFDTDIKVLKPFDECLEQNEAVLGLQSMGNLLTAFMAAVPGHPFFKECVDYYADRHFIKEDGSYDTVSINRSMNPIAERYGVNLFKNMIQKADCGIVVYPTDYFSAFDINNWHPVITDNTYTVHNMSSSWRPLKVRAKIVLIKLIIKVIGVNNYDKILGYLNK